MASNALNIYDQTIPDPSVLPIQTAVGAPKTEGQKVKAALPGLLGSSQVGSSDPILVNPQSAVEQSVFGAMTKQSNKPAPSTSIETDLTMDDISNVLNSPKSTAGVVNVPTQDVGQAPAQVTPEDVSAEVEQKFQSQPKVEKPVQGLMGDTGANANTPDYSNMWWEIAPTTSQMTGAWSKQYENPYTGQKTGNLPDGAQLMGLTPTNGQTNRDYDRAYQAGLLAGK